MGEDRRAVRGLREAVCAAQGCAARRLQNRGRLLPEAAGRREKAGDQGGGPGGSRESAVHRPDAHHRPAPAPGFPEQHAEAEHPGHLPPRLRRRQQRQGRLRHPGRHHRGGLPAGPLREAARAERQGAAAQHLPARLQLRGARHRRPLEGVRRHLPPRLRRPRLSSSRRSRPGHQPRSWHAALRSAGHREDAHRQAAGQVPQGSGAQDRQRPGDFEQVRWSGGGEHPESVRGCGEGAEAGGRELAAARRDLRRDRLHLQGSRIHERRHGRPRQHREPAAVKNRRR
mmetsp:Transcript_50573/g.149143  ORF Transcript_50573/g.149143 Transcript_50573/m.149143 type:complete len:285 (-) Transcript_50573:1257-2111(-)